MIADELRQQLAEEAAFWKKYNSQTVEISRERLALLEDIKYLAFQMAFDPHLHEQAIYSGMLQRRLFQYQERVRYEEENPCRDL